MMAMGVRPWAPLIAAAVFGICFGLPFLNGAFMRIWQPRIAADVQGRAFAAMQVMVWSTQPIAYVSGGLIADRVFGPMLMPGGALENSVGLLIGVGEGRGIAMTLAVAGLFVLAVTAYAAVLPHFRTAESLIPITVAPAPAPAPEEEGSGAASPVPV
jgi:MFS transporter, DHA3 family, macrolide efflux protein